MPCPTTGRRSVGADKAYDTTDFVAACRERKVTPHIAANVTRRGGSAIDGRTTRHPSYRLSQVVRKRIEEHFGWGKTIGRIRQTVFRGLQRVDQQFKLTMTASNLMRLARIPPAVNRPEDAMSRREERVAGEFMRRHRNESKTLRLYRKWQFRRCDWRHLKANSNSFLR